MENLHEFFSSHTEIKSVRKFQICLIRSKLKNIYCGVLQECHKILNSINIYVIINFSEFLP